MAGVNVEHHANLIQAASGTGSGTIEITASCTTRRASEEQR